jgi:hypothetical protein
MKWLPNPSLNQAQQNKKEIKSGKYHFGEESLND